MLKNFRSTTASWLESLSYNVMNVAKRIVGVAMPDAEHISPQPSVKFEPLLGGGADIRNRRQLLLVNYLATHHHATRAQLDQLLGVEN